MPQPSYRSSNSLDEARAALSSRLQRRQAEIERAVLTRVYAISSDSTPPDAEYLDGLRSAVAVAVDYGLAAVDLGEGDPPPIPLALVIQARLSARHRISLDTVLRRYIAASNLLRDFLVEECVGDETLPRAALPSLLRSHSVLLEEVLATVTDEYSRERAAQIDSSADARLAKRARQLLAGELIDIPGAAYDLETHHIGVITEGQDAARAVRELGEELDCRVLIVRPAEDTVWGWFGTQHGIERDRVGSLITAHWPEHLPLAVGETGRGRSGWCFTHQQAAAAFPIAARQEEVARYADVALLASITGDSLLTTSLHDLYIAPLTGGRDDGQRLLDTLRAYFVADRNVSATAAALGVSRQTVASRLRAVEEKIGRPISTCAPEAEAALRLSEDRSFRTAGRI